MNIKAWLCAIVKYKYFLYQRHNSKLPEDNITRMMFEAMESMSNYNKSARALCRLTETAIVTGQYEVALKYISILEETLFYKRWAQKMRQLATHPENIKNHPKYGALQKIYGETEDMLFI